MDLNFDMSLLTISTKRRRQSGLLGCVPPPGNEDPAEDDVDSSLNLNHTQPSCSTSFVEQTVPATSEYSEPSPSQSPTFSPEMGKTDSNLPVRRSSRRKSVINIESLSLPCPTSPNIQEADVEPDLKRLKKIYLDKRVRKRVPSLETIFETPSDDKIMSSRKFKRLISFQELQKNKVRKHPMKAKQTVANYNKLKRKNKVSMDALMQKLNSLENDS
ncbi:protein tantalus [Atheta coriaria]|uniref:protein tantalus n=1 Tax=Dalotia coriaria TaxID=877792 RepID=UPI0031F43203